MLLVAVVVPVRAGAAWRATAEPPAGPIAARATLVGDPTPLADGGWRAEARVDGRRLHLAFGAAHAVSADLLAGDSVDVDGSVVRPARRWQRIRHVVGTLEVDRVGAVDPAGPVHGAANDLRRLLARGAGPLDDAQRSLLAGLVLGDDRDQSATTTDDFRAAGLGHLLAVSGQNVAFVVAAVAPVLGRIRHRWRLPATLLLLGFFALLTRFEPSVLRATAMAGGSAVAVTLGRPVVGLRLLVATVGVLVMVDPLLVHRAAFRLSVAASAGILLAARPLADLLPGPRPLRDAVGVTMAAQSAVTPLLLAGFGPVPVAALPANVLAGPVAGPLMAWGLTGGLVAGLAVDAGWPTVARILHLPSAMGLDWISGVARWAADHPTGLLGPVLGTAVALGVGAAAFLSGRGRRRPGRRVLAGTGAVLLVVAIAAWTGGARPGAADGVRVLDPDGTVVVVDRVHRAERLLSTLRRHGVDAPRLVVFREPVPEAVALALDDRYGPHLRWGPPGSSTSAQPPDGQRIRVADTTWAVHLRRGRLLVRRVPEPVATGLDGTVEAPGERHPAGVPSAG